MAPIVVSTFHIVWCSFSLFIEINCVGTADLFWSTYGWYCSFLGVSKSYCKSFVLPLYTRKWSQIYVLVHTETWKDNFWCCSLHWFVCTERALFLLHLFNNENASICKKSHNLISVPMLTNTLCYPSNCNCLYTSQQSLLMTHATDNTSELPGLASGWKSSQQYYWESWFPSRFWYGNKVSGWLGIDTDNLGNLHWSIPGINFSCTVL